MEGDIMYNSLGKKPIVAPELTGIDSIEKGVSEAVESYKSAVEQQEVERQRFYDYLSSNRLGQSAPPIAQDKRDSINYDIFENVELEIPNQEDALETINELVANNNIQVVSNSNGFYTPNGAYLVIDEKTSYTENGLTVSLLSQGRVHNDGGLTPRAFIGDETGIAASAFNILASSVNNKAWDSQTTTAVSVSSGNLQATVGEWYQFGPRLSENTQKGVEVRYNEEDASTALIISDGIGVERRDKVSDGVEFIRSVGWNHGVLTANYGVEATVGDYDIGAVIRGDSQGAVTLSGVLKNHSGAEISGEVDQNGNYTIRAGMSFSY